MMDTKDPDSSWSDKFPSLVREAVVEGMKDGWIVLDPDGLIVDVNPEAEKIIGQERDILFGQPIHEFLGDLKLPRNVPGSIQELEMRRTERAQNLFRNVSVRSSSLTDRDGGLSGHLILLHDNTERKLADEAKLRERDEILVILNALSSAASNTEGLEEFLSESIYQVIHPFHSQVAAIFMISDKKRKNGELGLSLEAHFGLPPEAIKQLSRMTLGAPIFADVHRLGEAVQIERPQGDARVPTAIVNLEAVCFLVVPLIAKVGDVKKTLGFLCLGRNNKPVFSSNEIVRLNYIADRIATLIDSERRRNLQITLVERKRLERDLHDSVSQKLYALITLTEAAYAAIEANVDPMDIITKISEHARQAVKEMRLFLFQVQPLDVEREGLISVIHHRLAAVEGRADIKVTFYAGEKVTLDDSVSKEKEVAMYFIAQEALNNALRHSSAKTVTITLKEGPRNVILQIQDDGCGFDSKKVGRGGHGLQNMKERAALIDASLAVSSEPNKGTRVVITVPKDYVQ